MTYRSLNQLHCMHCSVSLHITCFAQGTMVFHLCGNDRRLEKRAYVKVEGGSSYIPVANASLRFKDCCKTKASVCAYRWQREVGRDRQERTIGVVTPLSSHSRRSENGDVAPSPWMAKGPFSKKISPQASCFLPAGLHSPFSEKATKGCHTFLCGEAILLAPLFPHSPFSDFREGVTTPNTDED
jgi:hypothetical protein